MATWVVIPPNPDFAFLAVPNGLAIALGAIFGGYYCYGHDFGVAEATGAAFGATLAICNIAGDFIGNLAPSSTAMFVIGWIVRWILGIDLALCAGLGAFWGAGAVWVIADVSGSVAHVHS